MKRLSILLLALVLQVGQVQAATLTITTDGATDTRLAVAYGKILNLGRNATAGEIKAEIIRRTIVDVQATEVQTSRDAITPTPVSQMN